MWESYRVKVSEKSKGAIIKLQKGMAIRPKLQEEFRQRRTGGVRLRGDQTRLKPWSHLQSRSLERETWNSQNGTKQKQYEKKGGNMRRVGNKVTPGVESGSLSAVLQVSVGRCTWTLCSGRHIGDSQDRPRHSWTASCSATEHWGISENNQKARGFHTDALTFTVEVLNVKLHQGKIIETVDSS